MSCCSRWVFRSHRAPCASTCRHRHLATHEAISVGPRSCATTPRRLSPAISFVAVTATFRMRYVFVLIHHGLRRMLHFSVTANPNAAWTLRQLRESIGFQEAHRYLLHDRDGVFAGSLDESIKNLGLTVLKSPPHSPKANAICERVIGTVRRVCMDWWIPLSESHLRLILKEWVAHYNGARPHMALCPGVPDPPAGPKLRANEKSRHHLGAQAMVCARSVLGGLHHECSLAHALG